MGQNGRKEFSQQNGATYGFFNKFLSVAITVKLSYIFFVWDRKDSLYFFISLICIYILTA